jgi:tetratricopeptide (TPR) repeat protein
MFLLAAAVFVGNQACSPCHSEIVDAYATTPMARSSGRVESLPPANFTVNNLRYRVAGNKLFFDGGSVSMDYFIGSNSAGRTYAHQTDGYLYESPVTWYTARKAWDASPGYERDREVRLTRAIEPGCLFCHSSQVRPVLGTQNRYGDPPFLENGVSCERCHGPGSEHVENPSESRMVHPAKLNEARRDSLCSQCHLTGEARVEKPGKRFAAFRAGDDIADYASFFVWKLRSENLKVTSHVEKLAASACKKSAGAALWCGTCHDLHSNTNKTQAACLNCHPNSHRQKENCATCHMPRTRVVDASHAVMTDHSIPPQAKAAAPDAVRELVPFLGASGDRELGLAYAELGDSRARQFLLRAQPQDWTVRLRLAVSEPNTARAAALYESVLRDNPGEVSALVNLGSLYAQAGRTTEASRLWDRALVANPAIEEAVLNLTLIRPVEESLSLLKRYLEFNPVSMKAKQRLAVLQKDSKQVE